MGNIKGGNMRGREPVGARRREPKNQTGKRGREGKKMSLKESKAKWKDDSGNIMWPENDGFDGGTRKMVLKPKTMIDRYGYNGGRFTAPLGTPYEKRSLFPGTKEEKPYHIFEVKKKVKVKEGVTAAWFDEPGGGIQYVFDNSIEYYLGNGTLEEKLVRQ